MHSRWRDGGGDGYRYDRVGDDDGCDCVVNCANDGKGDTIGNDEGGGNGNQDGDVIERRCT